MAYGYAHYGLLLGIVIVAAGIKKAVGHATGDLGFAAAAALAGGIEIFLISDVVFRRALAIGRLRFRAAAALVALATVTLAFVGALAQLGALIGLLLAMLIVEARRVPTSRTRDDHV